MWKDLGMHKIISNVVIVDRSDCKVVEFLLSDTPHQQSYMEPVDVLDMLVASFLYIWW